MCALCGQEGPTWTLALKTVELENLEQMGISLLYDKDKFIHHYKLCSKCFSKIEKLILGG